MAQSEHAALVLGIFLGCPFFSRDVLGTVHRSPAGHVQRAVRPNLDVGRAKQRATFCPLVAKVTPLRHTAIDHLTHGLRRHLQRAVPNRVVEEDAVVRPVGDQVAAAVFLGEMCGIIKHHAGAGTAHAGKQIGRWRDGHVFAHPVEHPRVTHGVVPMLHRHEDALARPAGIVVRAQPVEAAVHADVPRVAHAACKQLEVVPAQSTAEDTALSLALVHRVVTLRISFTRVHLSERILCLIVCLVALQLAERQRCVILHPRVAHAHVQPAIRPPVEAVQAVAQIVQPGENDLILVGHIVAVSVAQHGQFRRVGHPQFVVAPGHRLHRVQSVGEGLHGLGPAVAVLVDEDLDVIRRRIRTGMPVLRPGTDVEPPVFVEAQRGRVDDVRFLHEEPDLETFLDVRQRLRVHHSLHGPTAGHRQRATGRQRFELSCHCQNRPASNIVDIRVVDVRDTHHEHPHLADGPVHHAGRDVHHAALAHRAFLPVEHHRAFALEHVVQLGRDLVVVRLGPIDINRMGPRSDVLVTPTEQAIAVAACAAFTGCIRLVPQDQVGRWQRFRIIWHLE